jgi:hypothetical protein
VSRRIGFSNPKIRQLNEQGIRAQSLEGRGSGAVAAALSLSVTLRDLVAEGQLFAAGSDSDVRHCGSQVLMTPWDQIQLRESGQWGRLVDGILLMKCRGSGTGDD